MIKLNEYKCAFPGVLYRQIKQTRYLKLYEKKINGSLEELCDINRNSKEKNIFIILKISLLMIEIQ
jgi:hypothetical protein